MSERVQRAANLVPFLVEQAKRLHGREPRAVQVLAVVDAWRALAGVPGWTPEMVTEVERRMQGVRS